MSTHSATTMAIGGPSSSTSVDINGTMCQKHWPDMSAYIDCLASVESANNSGNYSVIVPFPSSNHSNTLALTESAGAVFIVLYSMLSLVSLIGNFGVCYIVVRKSRMRSVTNFFLANQALSDILMTVLNIPFVVTKQLTYHWAVGAVMCHLVDYMGVMSVYVSTFILTIIAIDRHRVLVHPLRPRITMCTAVIIAICIWILALVLAIPYAVFVKLEVYELNGATGYTCRESYPHEHWAATENAITWSTLMVQYVLPFTIIAASYMSIGKKLWSTRAVGVTMAAQQAANLKRKIRTTRLLVLAVMVFGVCWLPLHVYLIVTRYQAHLKDHFSYLCCHWFAMCSVCINPIAFCFLNENLRTDLRITISKFASRIRGTKLEGQNVNQTSLGGNPNSVTHQSGLTSDGSPRMTSKRVGPDDRNGNLVMVAAVSADLNGVQQASLV